MTGTHEWINSKSSDTDDSGAEFDFDVADVIIESLTYVHPREMDFSSMGLKELQLYRYIKGCKSLAINFCQICFLSLYFTIYENVVHLSCNNCQGLADVY
jgi:hypothetical protein